MFLLCLKPTSGSPSYLKPKFLYCPWNPQFGLKPLNVTIWHSLTSDLISYFPLAHTASATLAFQFLEHRRCLSQKDCGTGLYLECPSPEKGHCLLLHTFAVYFPVPLPLVLFKQIPFPILSTPLLISCFSFSIFILPGSVYIYCYSAFYLLFPKTKIFSYFAQWLAHNQYRVFLMC